MRAHQFLLKILRGDTMTVKALHTDPGQMVSLFVDMVSTPFAAFYLDLDPTKRTYRLIRSSLHTSVGAMMKVVFADENIPHAEEMSEDVLRCGRGTLTPLQRLFSGCLNNLLDFSMERITRALIESREQWKRSWRLGPSFVETRVFCVSFPDSAAQLTQLSLPTMTVTTKLLPADILPERGVRKVCDPFTSPFGPDPEDRRKILQVDDQTELEDFAEVPPDYATLLSAIKYELALYALDKEVIGFDIAEPKNQDKTITVDLITGVSE